MRRFIVAAVASIAVVGVLAGTVAASGGGGTVIREGFECAVLDGDGNSVITTDSKLTVFQSKSVMRCVAEGVAPADPPVVWNFANTGLVCNMAEFGTTENWTDRVGRNGVSQLTCYGPPEPVTTASSGGAGVG
jgi:hypothetical protein